MRNFLSVILIFVILLTGTACQEKPEEPVSTVTVYYKASQISYGTSDGVIIPYALDATGHEADNVYLLNTYFANIPPEKYAATFPPSTRVVSLNLDGLTAKIVLNEEFAKLTGLNLSIACACLTQTVIALTECHEVIISAENAQLDGNNFITLNRDSYLLLDESGAD